jgi:hypothetical protein
VIVDPVCEVRDQPLEFDVPGPVHRANAVFTVGVGSLNYMGLQKSGNYCTDRGAGTLTMQ